MSKKPGLIKTVLMLAALTLANPSTTAVAQNDSLVSDGIARRAGLTVQWNTQLQVGGPNKMVDWFLHVNEDESTTYFTLESGPLREIVSNRQLNARGDAYGIEGAKEEIAFRADILAARYKARGIEDFKIEQSNYSLPRSVLYTLGSNGIVSAIDADTGIHFWDRVIDSSLRVLGLGASNEHVAVVIGSKVFCLDAVDGRVLWDRATKYSPSASPAVSDSHIFVPLANGRLQAFDISAKGLGSNSFFASGFASARPLVTANGVAWVTESGQMNFANAKASDAVNFRLRANKAITSSPTGKGDMVFVASLDGYVYGVDRQQGRLSWDVTTGTGVSSSPIPIGDALFVVSDSQQLFKLQPQTGVFAEGWESPIEGVDKFLGATRKSIFVLNEFNRLLVIDQKSAQLTASIPVGDIEQVLTNYQSDRIYLASANGRIQCVRDVSNPRPVFHSSDFETSEMSKGDEMEMKKKAAEDADPFGDDADPFGDNADPFGDNANPARAKVDSDNPFGAPESDSDNPFGGDDADNDSDNPFGSDDVDSDSDNPFGSSDDEMEAKEMEAKDSPSPEEDDDDNPFN